MRGADAELGALFSWVRDARAPEGEDKNVYGADFYLVWNPFESFGTPTPDALIFLSAEGHVASNTDEANDAWRFRVHVEKFFKMGSSTQGPHGLDLNGSLKFEGDRDFETQVLLAELILTPVLPEWGIGKDLEIVKGGPRFRWRPLLALDVGTVLDQPSASTLDDTQLRLSPEINARLRLYERGTGRNLLLVDAIDLVVQDRFFYLPLEDARETANLFFVGAELAIRDDPVTGQQIGLSIGYSVGRDAPTFEKVEFIQAGLSVKF
jgi:hypothetical protein